MRLFRRFRPEENPFLVVRCKGGEGTVFLSCDRGKIVLCELLCVLLRDVAGKGNDEIVRRVEGFFMLLEICLRDRADNFFFFYLFSLPTNLHI